MADTVWTTVKVRRTLLDEATEAGLGSSNAGIVEHALRRALETDPHLQPPVIQKIQAVAVPPRAAVAQRRIEGQTTVEEMLASCPNCAGEFVESDNEDSLVCQDCGFVRDPEGT